MSTARSSIYPFKRIPHTCFFTLYERLLWVMPFFLQAALYISFPSPRSIFWIFSSISELFSPCWISGWIISLLSLAWGSSDASLFAFSTFPAFKYKKHIVARIVDFCFSLIDNGKPLSSSSITSSVFPFHASVLANPRIMPGLLGYISNASLYVFHPYHNLRIVDMPPLFMYIKSRFFCTNRIHTNE